MAETMATKKCECCGESFTRPKWKMRTQRFCSWKCVANAGWSKKKGKKVKKICLNCGGVFSLIPWKARLRKFCSSECAVDYYRGKPRAPKPRGKKSPLYKGPQLKHNGVWDFDENGKSRLVSRMVVEKIIGRKLGKEELVHHIDGNKGDNAPENLFLCKSRKEHGKAHHSFWLLAKELIQRGVVVFDTDSGEYFLMEDRKWRQEIQVG